MENDTYGRRPPPVRIGLAQARVQNRQMLEPLQLEPDRMAKAAGEYGPREPRFASVPIMLRFQRNAGPSSRIALRGTIPINRTRTKRGFAPVTSLPGEGE